MEANKITDGDTLQAWLEGQPEVTATSIAFRCALRVFVVTGPTIYRVQYKNPDATTLPSMRAMLTSGIAMKYRTSEISDANRSLATETDIWSTTEEGHAILAVVRSAHNLSKNDADASCLLAAVKSVSAATTFVGNLARGGTILAHSTPEMREQAFEAIENAREAIWNAIRQDAIALQSGTNPQTLPLWHNAPPPDWFSTAETAKRTYWQTQNPTHWEFWQRWYDAAIAGRPLDWQLQHDIALIPDAIWQSGPGPVAEAIARIEEEHSKGTAPPLQTDNLPTPTDRSRNIKFVVKQVTLLHELIEEEYEYLRGHNGGSATEQPLLDQQKATLQKLRDLVNAMLAALEGDPSPSTALTVVNETLPVVVTEAEALIDQGALPEVSANITSLAASIKVLTASGTPGTLATAIAFSELAMTGLKSAVTRRKKP